MPISSSTLFHFTSSISHLTNILTNEFRPFYSYEDFSSVGNYFTVDIEWAFAIPMVCFCDIPLSQAHKHMAIYGSYALGLTKEWGMRNNVSPVLYTHSQSAIAGILADLFNLSVHPSEPEDDQPEFSISDIQKHLVSILTLLKHYEGPFIRPGRTIPSVRFYDEREWRWLPPSLLQYKFLSKEQYLDFNSLRTANAGIWDSARLEFEPSDIRYIIVATEAEILPMIRELERIKEKYTEDVVKLVTSRIISAEQILSDF